MNVRRNLFLVTLIATIPVIANLDNLNIPAKPTKFIKSSPKNPYLERIQEVHRYSKKKGAPRYITICYLLSKTSDDEIHTKPDGK